MTLCLSRDIEAYLCTDSGALIPDGLTLLHLTKEKADEIEALFAPLGFQFRRFRLDEVVDENSYQEELGSFKPSDNKPPKPIKEDLRKVKKITMHNKKNELKRVLPEEVSKYQAEGWEIGWVKNW